jgi:hypothetical protein
LPAQSLFKAALHNAAALLVRPDFEGVLHASFVDEVSELGEALGAERVPLMREVCRFKPNNKVLNHVVSVDVGRER